MKDVPPRSSQDAVVMLLILASATAACRKATPQDEHATTEAPTAATAAEPPPEPRVPAVGSARCPKGGRTIGFGDAGPGGDLEIGDALAYAGGFAVSFARTRGATRSAAVAILGPEVAGPARIVELGPVLNDAPAPLLARRSSELLAAIFPMPSSRRGDRHRVLGVYALSSEQPPRVLGGLEQPDDSAVTDMASDGREVFVVWDEASSSGRGVIRLGPVADPQRSGAQVSPPESDAEVPRILFAGAGYTVLWIARSPEPSLAGDASEVPGELRSFGWLQGVELGRAGQVLGPVRDLTSRDGHVSAYDARALGDASVLIVARDDGEAADGSGGALLRVRLHGPMLEPAQKLAVDGVGRGAPVFVEGQPTWLSFTGHDELLRLLPLDELGLPGGAASAEDTMNESRPLATRLSSPGAKSQWLIATPTTAAGSLRVVECAPAKAL